MEKKGEETEEVFKSCLQTVQITGFSIHNEATGLNKY